MNTVQQVGYAGACFAVGISLWAIYISARTTVRLRRQWPVISAVGQLFLHVAQNPQDVGALSPEGAALVNRVLAEYYRLAKEAQQK